VYAHASQEYGKPEFGLHETEIGGERVPVRERIVLQKPFGQLVHFEREGREGDPKLLIVAPMSGHYATLLRGTVERLLPSFDVHITDWHDAKLVPLRHGRFDLDDYIDYVIEFTEHLGAGVNLLAVCQPSVPCLAAVSLMNANSSPFAPSTLTMMGGPVDTRRSPTAVNDLATRRPLAWFEQSLITTVPGWHPGGGRKVYPGFLQLTGFMSMNLSNHLKSHWEMFKHLVQGDHESAEATKAFYEEYRAVCDMTAEFYLQTVDKVFMRHELPRGVMMHRDQPIEPGAITRTALLAIEGERDDIAGLGQTLAALELETNLSDEMKQHYVVKGVGHYGIFNGRKWREEIAPAVESFVSRCG
jgi:poly(3-hydroxybutyrate) depolymerase